MDIKQNNNVNTFNILLSIKADVASLSTKIDGLKDAPAKAEEAKELAQEAKDIAIKNQEDAAKSFQWKLAMVGVVSSIIGGLAGALPSIL